MTSEFVAQPTLAARPNRCAAAPTRWTKPNSTEEMALVTLLWMTAVALMVAGVLALIGGKWRYGAGFIIAGFVVAPGLLRFVT
jgi:hypothetical protein